MRAYEESKERGWDAPDKFVCTECVGDSFLKDIVKENCASNQCSYCGKSSSENIAAPVEDIMPAISSGLHYYYNDPDSAGVPYEGGYVFEPTTTEEALLNISFEAHDDLFEDVVASFHNTLWTETAGGHWASTHLSDSMNSAWKKFVHTVKHECRYFFSAIPGDEIFPEDLPPTSLLKALGSMVSELILYEMMSADTDIYRVRTRDEDASWPLDFDQLGPPPNERANAGRMNPAGISYFYLAKDSQTAFAEVISKPPCNAALARFKTKKDLRILNLCDFPEIPSIFDEEGHQKRELIYFLLDFVKQISQPVSKNGQEHIDYVASQIVSEFFAKEFRTEGGERIDGLTYPSSIRPGGVNVILFPPVKGFAGFKDLASLESFKVVSIDDWNKAFVVIK